jgi:hypothetical protein
MAFVIDASIAAAWAFADEQVNAEVTFAGVAEEEAFVPPCGGMS